MREVGETNQCICSISEYIYKIEQRHERENKAMIKRSRTNL